VGKERSLADPRDLVGCVSSGGYYYGDNDYYTVISMTWKAGGGRQTLGRVRTRVGWRAVSVTNELPDKRIKIVAVEYSEYMWNGKG
jgi:hypothetical protein